MKYACNYLHEAIYLIKKAQIEIDYLKYPSLSRSNLNEIKQIRQQTNKDILLHGVIQYEDKDSEIISDMYQASININDTIQAINITNTPGISIHLNGNKDQNNYSEKELLEMLNKNIKYIKETFKNLNFYSLENKDYTDNKLLISPDFIKKAVYTTDCNFLLDISHAEYAAKTLGMNIYTYINQLPLEKVNEIHLNGWEYVNNQFISHIAMNEESYKVLEYILTICKPDILTLEYGITQEYLFKKFKNEEKYKSKYEYCKKDIINETVKNNIITQLNYIKELSYNK